MKKDYRLLMVGIAIAISGNAQMPLPCLVYESETQLEGFFGQLETHCVEINMGPWWAGIDDNHSRSFEVDEGSISPGTAESDGIVIVPGTDPLSGFQITLRQGGGEDELEAAWFEPTDSYNVPLYEKVEWGIILPAEVQTAIDNWISNDQNGTTLTPAINPFDPEQIDVWAEVWQPGANAYQPVYGFYYREYERIWEGNNPNNLPEMDDPDNWFRQEVPSDYDFRFRWSPSVEGWHAVKLHVHVPETGDWESVSFNFKALWNDPKKSFITTTPNKKYFQTADGSIFFPVGENIFPQQAECKGVLQNTQFNNGVTDCNLCYPEGNNSLLCGLDEFSEGVPLDWRGSFWRGEQSDMQRNTEHLATYLVQMQYMEAIKNAGANCFRTMPTGTSYDFEFEKVNNYYDRQFMAWELDDLFDKAHEIDLRVEYCMSVHFPFGNTYSTHWDWTNYENPNDPYYSTAQFVGHGYFEESDITNCDSEPISFFREENAKKYYKKKLRYFIARYGWCPEIIDLELVSEINNTGVRTPGNDWNWLYEQLGPELSYEASLESRDIIGQWQIEMANYIKNDLHHARHLIAADYTGQPMWGGDEVPSATCGDQFFDDAWGDPAIDIIAFSSYGLAKEDRWQMFSDPGDLNKFQWADMLCCEDAGNVPVPLCVDGKAARQQMIQKPVIHAECSTAPIIEDVASVEKEMWVTGFSGFASSGMHWGAMFPRDHWNKYPKVIQFMNEHVFPLGGFGNQNKWRTEYQLPSVGGNDPKLAEAVFMKFPSDGEQKAVGILMNRTWNTFSTTTLPARVQQSNEEGSTWKTYNDGKIVFQALGIDEFVSLSYDLDDAIKIDDMGLCNKFEIKYYDPYTLNLISTVEESTGLFSEKVKLKDFPELTWSRPYVLFKIVRVDDCVTGIFGMPEESGDTSAAISELRDPFDQTQNETAANLIVTLVQAENVVCVVSPNPSETSIRLSCDKAWRRVELFDAASRQMDIGQVRDGVMDLTSLSCGQYYLRVSFDDTVETIKIVKL